MNASLADDPAAPTRWRRRSVVGVAAAAFVAVAAIGLVLVRQARNDAVADVPVPGGGVSLDEGTPLLLFENTALGDGYGHLAVVAAVEPGAVRTVSDLQCERVHYRSGRGVCLRANRGASTTYDAVIFDDALDVGHRIPLLGPPSRVRVSPSGELAAATAFVTGHAYENGGFSTDTILIDLVDERVVAAMETDFTVLRNEAPWKEEDFNFWGVTFVDDNEFYATLGTGGAAYLVSGSLENRELILMEEGIECPSLSPDGRRLAYKRPITTGDEMRFQLEVIDLETLRRSRRWPSPAASTTRSNGSTTPP